MSAVFRTLAFAVLMVCFALPPSALSQSCGVSMNVANEQDMNDAIGCYNIGNIDSSISVSNNFTATAPFGTIAPTASTQLDIVGNGNKITFTGNAGDLFSISSGALVVENIELENAADAAIFADGSSAVVINNTIFKNNGHAISVTSSAASVSLEDSLVSDSPMAAVRLDAGFASVLNSTIDSTGFGGSGVEVSDGVLTLENSTVSNGSLNGVRVDGGDVTIERSTISDNRLTGVVNGGVNSEVLISNSTISNNRVAISADSGLTSVSNSTASYNDAWGIDVRGGEI